MFNKTTCATLNAEAELVCC